MKKRLLLPILAIAHYSHADSTNPIEYLELPEPSAISAVYYAEIPIEIYLARPVTPGEIFGPFAYRDKQEALMSKDPHTIAAIIESLAKLQVQKKIRNTASENAPIHFPPECQFSGGSAVLALEQKDAPWLFVAQTCLEKSDDAFRSDYSLLSGEITTYLALQWDDFIKNAQQILRHAQ